MQICPSKVVAAGAVPVFTLPVTSIEDALILLIGEDSALRRSVQTSTLPAVVQICLAGAHR